jgi:hypothetical protein
VEAFFIEDGYTVSTYIPRVAGLHPACKLVYRPALMEEKQQLIEDAARLLMPARIKALAEHIGRHVVSWDLATLHKKEVSPKDADMVRRMQPVLFEKVLDCINGTRPAEEAADVGNSLAGSASAS